MFPGLLPSLPQVFGPHKILGRRKPRANHDRAHQVERGQDQESSAPLPVSGDEAGEKASEKPTDHGSRHIRRHGAPDAACGTFLIDVSEHDGDDAGHEKPLGESPEDQ